MATKDEDLNKRIKAVSDVMFLRHVKKGVCGMLRLVTCCMVIWANSAIA